MNTPTKDPAEAPVQMTVRVPWGYRTKLITTAREQGKSLNTLILETLQKGIPA